MPLDLDRLASGLGRRGDRLLEQRDLAIHARTLRRLNSRKRATRAGEDSKWGWRR